MKIRPVGVELCHLDGLTDGRTDTAKLIVAFRNFANASTNLKTYTKGKSVRYVLLANVIGVTKVRWMKQTTLSCMGDMRHVYRLIDQKS
jgi:hypothetical protein